MALAEVDIVNLALISLKSDRLNALDEATIKAQKWQLQYQLSQPELLSRYPWTFAMDRAEIAAAVTAPAFEFAYQYPLPADCLTVWKLNDWQFPSQNFTVEGRKILTDIASPVKLRYIAQLTNTELFHPLFVRALSKLLAFEMCYETTGSNNLRQQIAQEFQEAIQTASNINAIGSGTPEEFVADDWLISRY